MVCFTLNRTPGVVGGGVGVPDSWGNPVISLPLPLCTYRLVPMLFHGCKLSATVQCRIIFIFVYGDMYDV